MCPLPSHVRLGSVLSPRDLPVAELHSARLDGDVYALGDFWCPIDEVDGPRNRARAAALLVPVSVVAERGTAAWIYGLLPEPLCHELRLDSKARKHVNASFRARVREVRYPFADTEVYGGVAVTTALRTAVDLALCRQHDVDALGETHLIRLLAGLLRYSGCFDTENAARLCVPTRSATAQRATARFAAVQQLFDEGSA